MDRDEFGSSYPIGDKLRADIIDETPSAFYVAYPDGEKEMEPRNAKNELLFGTDAIDPDETVFTFEGEAFGTADYGGHIDGGILVQFEVDLVAGAGTIRTDELEVELDGDELFEALAIVVDFLEYEPELGTEMERDEAEQRIETATALYEYAVDVRADRVRPAVVAELYGRYTDEGDTDRIVDVHNGVVVDDTFKVTYDGENYLVDDPGTHKIQNGDVVEVDETHQFLDIDFETSDVRSIEFAGETYAITAAEQRFLATIETLCYPERHLDVRMANRVEKAVDEQPGDEIGEIASTGNVRAYKDRVSGLVHPHGIDKHTLTASFSVREWVLDGMHYTEYDHAGVNELAAMESELREADRDVFYDTHNRDDERWESITATAGNAQIPAEVQHDIDRRHGN